MKGILYLIPSTLSDGSVESVIPSEVAVLIKQLTHFAVENERTARRFLKRVDSSIDINVLTFVILDKDTAASGREGMVKLMESGVNLGVISEAGCPGIADPGADLVQLAHQHKLVIKPLVGPSSILLAMMGSGMNGQSFAFNGYLPVKKAEKISRLHFFESRSFSEKQAQIFIEAPYRNLQLLEDILVACKPATRLCIACDITSETEMIVTKTIAEWKKSSLPDIQKKPAIFIIQA